MNGGCSRPTFSEFDSLSRMIKTIPIARRTFLRGMGTAIALPFLESLGPAKLLAGATSEAGAGSFPRRLAFLYVPNGMNMADWTPAETGAEFELPFILEPL